MGQLFGRISALFFLALSQIKVKLGLTRIFRSWTIIIMLTKFLRNEICYVPRKKIGRRKNDEKRGASFLEGGMPLLTCLENTAMSSLKDSDEQTSPPATEGSRGVHVANSHFSKMRAKRGKSGCLKRELKKIIKTFILFSTCLCLISWWLITHPVGLNV